MPRRPAGRPRGASSCFRPWTGTSSPGCARSARSRWSRRACSAPMTRCGPWRPAATDLGQQPRRPPAGHGDRGRRCAAGDRGGRRRSRAAGRRRRRASRHRRAEGPGPRRRPRRGRATGAVGPGGRRRGRRAASPRDPARRAVAGDGAGRLPPLDEITLDLVVGGWSRRWDSNPRPSVYETDALPLSYFGRARGPILANPGTSETDRRRWRPYSGGIQPWMSSS